MSVAYDLQVAYPQASEDINSLKRLLGQEYLKLIRLYLESQNIGISQKKEIVSLISTEIKTVSK